MRVLFTVSNWAGHYFCMIPLGWALQAAGHEVRVACPKAQAAAISSAGLVPVPVLDWLDHLYLGRMAAYEEAISGQRTMPGLPVNPLTNEPVNSLDEFDFAAEYERFVTRFTAATKSSLDAAVEFARDWRPSIVVHDQISMEGPLAARVIGAPVVFHPLGLFGSMETERQLDIMPADWTHSFERHGVAPWDREQVEYVIDPSPESALPPFGSALRLPVRYVPYNGPVTQTPPPMPPSSGRPRVCVIWGRTATGTFGTGVPALRWALDAALAAGAEVTLTAGAEQVEALGELPSSVRVLRDFPLRLLLEGSDAIIHHGSANPLMTAAVMGLPQLSLALTNDAIYTSERMAPTGAVITRPSLSATEDDVHDATTALLTDPKYREAAARLREELTSYPTPAELVKPLERLAREGHLRGASV